VVVVWLVCRHLAVVVSVTYMTVLYTTVVSITSTYNITSASAFYSFENPQLHRSADPHFTGYRKLTVVSVHRDGKSVDGK